MGDKAHGVSLSPLGVARVARVPLIQAGTSKSRKTLGLTPSVCANLQMFAREETLKPHVICAALLTLACGVEAAEAPLAIQSPSSRSKWRWPRRSWRVLKKASDQRRPKWRHWGVLIRGSAIVYIGRRTLRRSSEVSTCGPRRR